MCVFATEIAACLVVAVAGSDIITLGISLIPTYTGRSSSSCLNSVRFLTIHHHMCGRATVWHVLRRLLHRSGCFGKLPLSPRIRKSFRLQIFPVHICNSIEQVGRSKPAYFWSDRLFGIDFFPCMVISRHDEGTERRDWWLFLWFLLVASVAIAVVAYNLTTVFTSHFLIPTTACLLRILAKAPSRRVWALVRNALVGSNGPCSSSHPSLSVFASSFTQASAAIGFLGACAQNGIEVSGPIWYAQSGDTKLLGGLMWWMRFWL